MASFRAALVLCALIALADAPLAGAAPYQFTKIADTDTPAPIGSFAEFLSVPAVEGSRVAFTGHYGDGQTEGAAVLMGDGGPLTVVAKSGDPTPEGGAFAHSFFNFWGAEPVLDEGMSVFVGWSDDGQVGMYRGNSGVLSTIALVGDPAPVGAFSSFGGLAVEGATVAFTGGYRFGESSGVFTKMAGVVTPISKRGDAAPLGQFTVYQSGVALSGNTVAFAASFNNTGWGVFTSNGGPLTTIAKTGDPAPTGTFGTLLNNPAISGETVAFGGSLTTGWGIFTGSGGALTTVVAAGDAAPVGTFTGYGGIAISGDLVVFTGYYDNDTKFGIFARNGGMLVPIVKSGDSLFGSTVSTVQIGRHSLDPGGSGNLAFNFTLEDGRWGIALARAVPEPQAAWLIGVSALQMARVKRRLSLRGADGRQLQPATSREAPGSTAPARSAARQRS